MAVGLCVCLVRPAGRVDHALLGVSCQSDISSSMMGDINIDDLDEMVFLRHLCTLALSWRKTWNLPASVSVAEHQWLFSVSLCASLVFPRRKVGFLLKSDHSFSQHTFLQVTF